VKTLAESPNRSGVAGWQRASSPAAAPEFDGGEQTLIDQLLSEQRTLTAVEKFACDHNHGGASRKSLYRDLIPIRSPQAGEQYAFTVDLDKCSGCKACVSACHSLNGLDDNEVWRTVGLLTSPHRAGAIHAPPGGSPAIQQHVTTACHHCVEPGCLEGCPVLAYEKDPGTGIVRHLDDQCIGCNYCVMKCPYEVPKYSSRLGIVRKCDMCASRLSVGEAPACVQACPTEAIRITLIKPFEIKTEFRRAPSHGSQTSPFLPDSPDPRVTLPTTRYVSRRGLSAKLLGADHNQPRLDDAHWPMAIMLLLTQSSTGMFLVAAIATALGVAAGVLPLFLAAFATFVAGLAASVLHLGQPLRAWRCFLGWRKSWLSREIILFSALAAAATPAAGVGLAREFHLPWLHVMANMPQTAFALLAAVPAYLGLAAVFASAMVYVDTHRPFWSVRLAFGSFFGTVVLLGAAFGAMILAADGAPSVAVRTASLVALVLQGGLFAWRWLEFRRPLGDGTSPVHLNARAIKELLPWAAPALAVLSAISMLCGICAIAGVFNASTVWITLAAIASAGSEVISRHIFFAAGAGKRMPGGIPS
jgi:formate dehydrogenase iron-sulfur subunit